MADNGIKHHSVRSRISRKIPSIRIRELAEAGAKGRMLTPVEIREVCEALQTQSQMVRNQFHSG